MDFSSSKFSLSFIPMPLWQGKWEAILEPQETDPRVCYLFGVWKEMVNRQLFQAAEFRKPWDTGLADLILDIKACFGLMRKQMKIIPLWWLFSPISEFNSSLTPRLNNSQTSKFPTPPAFFLPSQGNPWKLLTFCSNYVTNCCAFIHFGHLCQACLLCFLFGCVMGPKVPAFVQHVKSG